MSSSLPVKPSLEHLKKEAKQLLRSHRKGETAAIEPLKLLPKFARSSDAEIFKDKLSLQEVQHALALRYGFNGWKSMRESVEPTVKGRKEQRQISIEEQWDMFLNFMVDKSKEIHAGNGGRPVRIADLATGGGHGGLPWISKRLIEEGVDFEFVFTDISAGALKRFHDRFEFSEEQRKRLKFVAVDLLDSRKELTKTVIFGGGRREIEIAQILDDADYRFLAEGYENGRRKESFADESFDLLCCTGFSELGDDIERAAKETARILKKGGFLIVTDGYLVEIKSYLRRALRAMKDIAVSPWNIGGAFNTIRGTLKGISRAKNPKEKAIVEEIISRLGSHLTLKSLTWAIQDRKHDDGKAGNVWQIGDQLKWALAIFQKEA